MKTVISDDVSLKEKKITYDLHIEKVLHGNNNEWKGDVLIKN